MDTLEEYKQLINDYVRKDFTKFFHEPIGGDLSYPFFTSGINYSNQVWDWGSWLAEIALMDIDKDYCEKYVKGVTLNFLNAMDKDGRIPLLIDAKKLSTFLDIVKNCHKPCLALRANEVCKKYGDYMWLSDYFDHFKKFISYYETHQYHEESKLFVWADDGCIGTDNNPMVFNRPDYSTGDILLNCLMYLELLSVSEIAKNLGKFDDEQIYKQKAETLKKAINDECYDPITGFYYSADVSLRKIDKNAFLHSGFPRTWHSLPIKIVTWLGMFPMFCGIASKEQAEKLIVMYKDRLISDFGIFSLAKNEKMYCPVDSGNPSCWLGPVWINANYFVYEGFKKYGYFDLARDIADKTIYVLGKDLKENGGFHEYYDGDSGKGLRGLGMHGWNFLVIKME